MYCAIYGDGMVFSFLTIPAHISAFIDQMDGRFTVFCTHAMIL
jgi:hypothetical protein